MKRRKPTIKEEFPTLDFDQMILRTISRKLENLASEIMPLRFGYRVIVSGFAERWRPTKNSARALGHRLVKKRRRHLEQQAYGIRNKETIR